MTHREQNHPFTECASFADDIKSEMGFQSGWHFIDQPYLDQGGSLDDFTFVADEHQIIDALSALTHFLTSNQQDNFYVQKVLSNFPDTQDARSFALRMIIHYVGDIH